MRNGIFLVALMLVSSHLVASETAQSADPSAGPATIFEAGIDGSVIFNSAGETGNVPAAQTFRFFQADLSGQALEEAMVPDEDSQPEGGSPSLAEIAFLSGHYFDPGNQGDGFDFFVVDRGNNPPGIVVWFYGYDLGGNRLWLISDLIIPSDASGFTNQPMFRSTGSGFSGAGNYQPLEWGRLDFASTGCGTAVFTLTPNGQAPRVTNAVQLIDIPGPGCVRESPRAFETIAGLSGNWFRPGEPGDGFNVHVANSGLVIFFYGYNGLGNPLWLLSEVPYFGPILPGLELTFNLKTGSGGSFYNASSASTNVWGTMTLLFKDCTTAEARLNGTDGTKQVSVVQLAQAAESLCASPGTVELSQPMVTFDSLGEIRVVEAEVFNAQGGLSTSSALSIEIQDENIASINSSNNGLVELESETNSISATRATFFDPITNSVEEAEIQVVDFQPNAFVIPVDDVISGNTPLAGQIGEVVLERSPVADALQPQHYIWVEDGLYGRVDSLQLESDRVRIQLLGVKLIEVLANLALEGGGTTSSAQMAGNMRINQVEKSTSTLQQTGTSEFSNLIQGATASCFINGDPISIGDYSWNVSVDQPGQALSRVYRIVNGVPSSDSRVEGRLRLTGEFDIDLPTSPPLRSTIDCEVANLTLQTPATPLWGQYSGGLIFPVDISVQFTIVSEPPDQLARFEWGIEPTFTYWFATQELEMGLDTGLTGSRVANFSPTAFASVPPESLINVTPSLNSRIGLYGDGPRTDFEQMNLIQADFGFPLDVSFDGPADMADRDFRGPEHLLSLEIFAQQDVDNASPLLDPLGFDVPSLPVDVLIPPSEIPLRGSPVLEIVDLGCGNLCGVGDPRQFAITLSRPGLVNFAMTGELDVYRLQELSEFGFTASLLGSTVFTGQTPDTLIFQVTPDSGGFWEIAPRFTSWDHGGVYGGPSVTFDVNDDSCALNVTVNGNGIVDSDPSGISCPDDCSEVYPFGTQVFMDASAGSGSAFESWDGCDATDGPFCLVVMECGRSVEANFMSLPAE